MEQLHWFCHLLAELPPFGSHYLNLSLLCVDLKAYMHVGVETSVSFYS